MPRRDRVDAPIPQDPASCYPSAEMPGCRHCSRRRTNALVEDRLHVVIDASVHARSGICGMFRLEIPVHVEATREAA